MGKLPCEVLIKDSTRKRCAACDGKIEVGDSCLEFMYSSFGGRDQMRLAHINCILNSQMRLEVKNG